MIQKERINVLNKEETQARRYVLYWMQASQRSEYQPCAKAEEWDVGAKRNNAWREVRSKLGDLPGRARPEDGYPRVTHPGFCLTNKIIH